MKRSALILLTILFPVLVMAQVCKVAAHVNTIKNYCGYPFTPFAIADAGEYTLVYANDFNTKTLGLGWSTTSNVSFDNPCGVNDGTPYLWMGSGTAANREIATNGLDLSFGGRICFDLKFAETNGTDVAAPDCEAPDLKNEGVYLDYSTDGGNFWSTIFYFDPTPFPRVDYTSWRNYCFTLPEEAKSTTTRIRWRQIDPSGTNVDHWGIDNVKIESNPKNYEYIWDHTTVKTDKPGSHIPPTSPFTYHVIYRDKVTGKQCESSITVENITPTVDISALPTSICEGQTSQLKGNYAFNSGLQNCSVQNVGCMGASNKITVGLGNTPNKKIFSNGSIVSNKVQWIIKPSEIYNGQAQISGIDLNLNITGANADDYFNFNLALACSAQNDFSNNKFANGTANVYKRDVQRLKSGWNIFTFDKPFTWDGTSNLIIELCFANPINGRDIAVTSENTVSQQIITGISGSYNTNICSITNGTSNSNRPITRINYCYYSPPNSLVYSWTNGLSLSDSTILNPIAKPTSTTSYTLSIKDNNAPHCFASGAVTVTTKKVNTSRDTVITLCKTFGALNLNNYLSANSDKSGTWRTPAGAITASAINTNTAQAGTYTYTISDPVCGTFTSKLTLFLENSASAGNDGTVTVCITDKAVSLFTFLQNSPASGGTWSDNNTTGALTNGIFDPSKYNKTGTVSFTYTVTNTNGCPPQSAKVTVTIQALPNAGTNNEIIVCNTGATINLLANLSGNPTNGGTWTNTNNQGSINGNILNLNGVPKGKYSFTYNLLGNTVCPGTQAILTINVVDLPNAGRDTTILICNTSNSINLFTALAGNPDSGGKWADLSGTGKMTSEGIFTLTGLNEGNYVFSYSINVASCPKVEAKITIALKKQNFSGSGRDTLLCTGGNFNLSLLLKNQSNGGVWSSSNASNALTNSTFNTNLLGSGTYNFTYSVSSLAPCVNQNTSVVVTTQVQKKAGIGSNFTLCEGEIIDLKTKFSQTGETNGKWLNSNTTIGFNSTTGVWNSSGVSVGKYTFKYVVLNAAPCSNDTSTFEIQVNDKPKFGQASYTCIDGNRNYKASIPVNFGDRASYNISPAGGILNLSPPPSYTTAALKSKTSITYYINDKNRCGPDSIVLFQNCGCVTFSGSTQPDTLNVCETSLAKANYDNKFENDGDDTLLFILHEGNGKQIINERARNTKPEFNYTANLTFGKVYYISALAATKDASLGYKQQDTCLSIAQGTPVIFFPNPKASFTNNSPICEGSTITVSSIFSSGYSPYSFEYLLNGIRKNATDSNQTITLNIQAQKGTKLITTQLTAGRCSVKTNDTIQLHVEDSLVISQATYACNVDNNAYTAQFRISKGNSSKYTVSGVNGSITTGIFTSTLLANGSSRTVLVSDGGICPSKSIVLEHTCPCISNAGGFNSTKLLKICGTDSARLTHNKQQVLDGNDKFIFALHSDSLAPFTVLKYNNQAVFAFDALTMQYGKTYYISGFTADSTNVGLVNFGDSCFSSTRAVPVQFFPIPTASLNGSITQCENLPLILPIQFTGIGPFYLSLSDQNNKTIIFDQLAKDSVIRLFPTAGSYTYKLIRIRDLASGCEGIANGTFSADIIAAPKATLIGDTAYCFGYQQHQLKISFQGVKPYDYTLAINGQDTLSFNDVDSVSFVKVNPPIGANYFSINKIRDKSPAACLGLSKDTVKVLVNPIPHFTLSGIDTVCFGDSARLQITLSNIPANYQSNYTVQLRNINSGKIQNITLSAQITSVKTEALLGANSYELLSVSDLNSLCTGSYSGTASAFSVGLPQASLSGDTLVCDLSPNKLAVKFKLKGFAPLSVYYSNSKGEKFTFNASDTTNQLVKFNTHSIGTTTYTLDSVVDGSPKQCKGTLLGSAQITVRDLPTAQLTINGLKSDSLCFGDSVNLELKAQGNYPILLDLVLDGMQTTPLSIVNAASQLITIKPPLGYHSYVITNIRHYTSPSCYSTKNDSVKIHTENIPSAKLEIENTRICENETAYLRFTTTGPGEQKIRYSIDNVEQNSLKTSGQFLRFGIDLTPGTHTIKLIEVTNNSNLACIGSLIQTDSVLTIRSKPKLSTLYALPNPVCKGEGVTVTIEFETSESYAVQLSLNDSVWSATLNKTDSIHLNSINTKSTFTLLDVAYANGSACTQNLNEKLIIDTFALPTARLITIDKNVCEGEKLNIRIAVTGNGTVSGFFSDEKQNRFYFAENEGQFNKVIQADSSMAYYFETLTLKDSNGCINTGSDTVRTTVYPLPKLNFSATNTEACLPLETKLIAFNSAQNQLKDCIWTIGQEHTFTSCDSTPTFHLSIPGSYDVSLEATSLEGCKSKHTKKAFLHVRPLPKADFTYSPTKIYISNPLVQFSDHSTLAHTWFWDFGSLGTSNQANPSLLLPTEPEFSMLAKLKVQSEFGCIDSTMQTLTVLGELLVNVPNTFTPNNDGKNDVFLPILYGANETRNYELLIFNRWGELLFRTTDLQTSWNGIYKGALVENGVYLYKIKVQSKFSLDIKEFSGHVNVLR